MLSKFTRPHSTQSCGCFCTTFHPFLLPVFFHFTKRACHFIWKGFSPMSRLLHKSKLHSAGLKRPRNINSVKVSKCGGESVIVTARPGNYIFIICNNTHHIWHISLSHNNEDQMIDTATSRALRTHDLQFEWNYVTIINSVSYTAMVV